MVGNLYVAHKFCSFSIEMEITKLQKNDSLLFTPGPFEPDEGHKVVCYAPSYDIEIIDTV